MRECVRDKERPRFNPLIVHVPDWSGAAALAEFNATCRGARPTAFGRGVDAGAAAQRRLPGCRFSRAPGCTPLRFACSGPSRRAALLSKQRACRSRRPAPIARAGSVRPARRQCAQELDGRVAADLRRRRLCCRHRIDSDRVCRGYSRCCCGRAPLRARKNRENYGPARCAPDATCNRRTRDDGSHYAPRAIIAAERGECAAPARHCSRSVRKLLSERGQLLQSQRAWGPAGSSRQSVCHAPQARQHRR